MAGFYHSLLKQIRKYHLAKPIVLIARITPYLVAGIYALTIIYLACYDHHSLLKVIIKPLTAFIIVTVIRKIYDRPRPCITMDLTPLVGHKTGESFPSRHTVSAFSIALALYSVSPVLGNATLVLALIVAATRILCGLHHISDVLAAIMISLLIFWI
ncbi:phosphatase PAP2 family protein [[Clostridium] spiroforme]|nr:phosphatase PAP2 family protein [Thomasclavelia spiroformis]